MNRRERGVGFLYLLCDTGVSNMKIEINDIKGFIKLFDALSPMLSTDLFMIVDPEKIRVEEIDPTHTSLVNLTIDNKYFESYDVEEEYNIPLDYETFIKYLNMFSGFKMLKLEYIPENNRVNMSAAEGKKRKKTHIQTIEVDHEIVPTVKATYTAMITIASSEFDRAVKDANTVTEDELVLECDGNEFIISANSVGASTQDAWKIGEDALALLQGSCSSKFPTKTLSEISAKAKGCSKNILISLATDTPVKLTYSFPYGSLIYYTVPIIR